MVSSVLEQVHKVAARQHGAITVVQLLRCGMTTKRRGSAETSGWLRPVGRDVLVVAGAPDTWRQRLHIGLLGLGEEAWVSHEAAASLHGLDRCLPEPVEFCVPRSCRGNSLPAGVHTTTVLESCDLIRVDGFRCTSATRTIIDLAYLGVPQARLEAAIDSSVRLRLSAPATLLRRLKELRGPGRHGVRALDKLIVDSGGESMLERRFLALMRRAGLPRPVTQKAFRHASRYVARVDFCFAEYRIVVEVSGKLGHSSPSERRKDAQRRNELLDLGLRVYEYTWSDVTDRAEHVTSTMRRRLRAAGWYPSVPTPVSAG